MMSHDKGVSITIPKKIKQNYGHLTNTSRPKYTIDASLSELEAKGHSNHFKVNADLLDFNGHLNNKV